MLAGERRTAITNGESGATVVRVQAAGGATWIEKSGPVEEICAEADVLVWCAGRLPVPRVLEQTAGLLRMTEVPGTNLAEASLHDALQVIVQALDLIHGMPWEGCPFDASWTVRIRQAERRMKAGLVNPADFGDENAGRDPADLLAELASFAPLPPTKCFTHGDGSLPNFLSDQGELSGIIDWGRAGVTHPAQDWALALRSMRSNFGPEAERKLYEKVPDNSRDERLLRRFRLLDEFF